MSYQQFPPASGPSGAGGPGVPTGPLGQQPVVQQPGAPFAPVAPGPAGGRRAGLIGIGVLLLAAGLVAGIVLFLASSSNYDEGVQNLARAPIGCTTSLEFDEAGTYTIYVETRGEIGELRGDCPNADTDYDIGDLTGEELPDVDIVIVDADGDEIDLDDDDSKDYDAAGFVGRSVSTVEIPEVGDYEITATSDENEFAVAIGRNPKETAGSMKQTAILALALGALFGGVCLAFGMRRRPPPGAGVPPAVGGTGGMGAGPMGTSPYSGQVPVTRPPASYPPAPAPSYQPPSYQPPAPPAPPAAPAPPPTIPMPSVPATPPAPPTGGPNWPAPPRA